MACCQAAGGSKLDGILEDFFPTRHGTVCLTTMSLPAPIKEADLWPPLLFTQRSGEAFQTDDSRQSMIWCLRSSVMWAVKAGTRTRRADNYSLYEESRVAACRGSYESGNRIQNKENWCVRASKAAMGGRKHLLHVIQFKEYKDYKNWVGNTK
jgi:hypothetical protein